MRAINCCWFAFKWAAALAVVAGAAAAFHYYRQVDVEVRRRLEARLAQHYPGLRPSIRSAQLVEGKGIRIYGLSIVEPGAEGPRAELLHVEEAFFECSTDWKDLLGGDPLVRRVTFRRPTLRMTRRPDGTWSAGKLLPPPHFGDHPPQCDVENGTVEIFEPLKTPASTFVLRDVSFVMAPEPAAEAGSTPGMRRLKGMLAGDGFRGLEFDGLVDLLTPACSIRGHVETLEISPELRDSLPDPLGSKLSALGSACNLRGQGSVQFDIRYDPAAAAPLKYDVAARLGPARLDDPRLPHGLTDIRAAIRVNDSGWAISDLTARSGQATLRIPSCQQAGFEPASPLLLAAEVRQLDLDRSLFDVLPPLLQEQWKKYWPAGVVDADARLSYDGRAWRPEQVAVRCQNVSFEHYKFPYRVEHGQGTVELTGDLLTLNLTAYSGSQPLRLTAKVANPVNAPTGVFEVEGQDIPLDERLIRALPEKPQEVVRSLHPGGAISFYQKLWREKPDERLHEHLHVEANRCSIRYDRFSYPLTNVSGTLEMLDGAWTFRNLKGNNNAASVTGAGYLTPGLQGNELQLNFAAKDVPLEKDLSDALSPNIQQVWYGMRPRGVVDLTTEIRYLVEKKEFHVDVRAEPQRDSASIEPMYFPYRLDRLQARWRITTGTSASRAPRAAITSGPGTGRSMSPQKVRAISRPTGAGVCTSTTCGPKRSTPTAIWSMPCRSG